MKVIAHDDGPSLLASDRRFFERTEAEHNLLIGAALRAVSPDDGAWVRALHDGAALVGAALHIDAQNVVLTAMPDAALDALCVALRADGRALSGASGPRAVAHAFAARWNALTGARAEVTMRQGLYELTALRAPADVPGRLREATSADRERALAWTEGFNEDARIPPGHRAGTRATVSARLLTGGMYFWETDAPVSMTLRGASTLRGGRVTGVYTPPALRGRGYASACVAAVSRRLLDDGWERCFLFTDLANPTSNKIYADIGYAQRCEYATLRFV
jgi:predicted GNAT family acetyltransferase